MWLCVRFPLLPLESLWLESTASHAVAVSERHKVVCCNQVAYQQGIREQQNVSTAYALSDDVQIHERKPHQELQTLNNTALKLYRVSPVISVWPSNKLLIEVGRSLRLHRGLDNLLSDIKSLVSQFGLTATLAIGPTPKSADLFSYLELSESYTLWQNGRQAFSSKAFTQLIGEQPIGLLPFDRKVQDKANAVGLTIVNELLKLPDGALIKRFGKDVYVYLQQLLGKQSDIQTTISLPIKFDTQIELVDTIHHTEALIFPMKRLLQDLTAFLHLNQKTGQSIEWTLTDIYRNKIEFDVVLADSGVQYESYLELTRLRLESIKLSGPVEFIRLTMAELYSLELANHDLFSSLEPFDDELKFANKIQARLGNGSCYWLRTENAVVPELSSRLIKNEQVLKGVSSKNNKISKNEIAEASHLYSTLHKTRPSWLLPTPKTIGKNPDKLYWNSKVTLISQPERITHFWWKKPVARDYFIARNTEGVVCWVFYDELKDTWFLQGFFS